MFGPAGSMDVAAGSFGFTCPMLKYLNTFYVDRFRSSIEWALTKLVTKARLVAPN